MDRLENAKSIQVLRAAVQTLLTALNDPDADPRSVTSAHRGVLAARHNPEPLVRQWAEAYAEGIKNETSPCGIAAAVLVLAVHFKMNTTEIPPIPRVGEQGQLFADDDGSLRH